MKPKKLESSWFNQQHVFKHTLPYQKLHHKTHDFICWQTVKLWKNDTALSKRRDTVYSCEWDWERHSQVGQDHITVVCSHRSVFLEGKTENKSLVLQWHVNNAASHPLLPIMWRGSSSAGKDEQFHTVWYHNMLYDATIYDRSILSGWQLVQQ